MKGFLHAGCTIFMMIEVTEAEMDALIAGSGDHWWDWPYRFDRKKRVWPRPPAKSEVFFYE